MKYHKTKDGTKIKLTDLRYDHLQNIIKWIERKAKEGMVIRSGGGSTADDMWYDEDEIKGDEVLDYLNYTAYTDELAHRLNDMPHPKSYYNV